MSSGRECECMSWASGTVDRHCAHLGELNIHWYEWNSGAHSICGPDTYVEDTGRKVHTMASMHTSRDEAEAEFRNREEKLLAT